MQDRKLKLCCSGGGLPYNMGNAGDLLKHGMLAEFVRWRCESLGPDKPFRFLDPFGGLPFCGKGASWCDGENPAIERFRGLAEAMPKCALAHAHENMPNRYCGSGRVVRSIAGENAEILFSDICPDKRKLLSDQEGFTELEARGFDPRDGYSALNSINQECIDADLVLIDPFSDFLMCRQEDVLPRIAEASERTAVVLFVLNMNPKNSIGKKWERMKKEFLPDAWTLSCPRISRSGIKGESGCDVEVVLVAPCLRDSDEESLREFNARLARFAKAVCRVVEPVRLTPVL